MTCGAGVLRKKVADDVDSGNFGTVGANGGNTANCVATDSVKAAEDAGSADAGRVVAAGERRVTQAALVLALEAVSEPLWALVKTVGAGDGVQSA